MKAFNVVLSIMILLLAVILAASSYFLYEKREVMLDGWNQMASAINQTAAVLDRESGTKVAEQLTTDTLGHAMYGNLKEELPKLVTATESVVKQRNSAASALREIALAQDMKNVPADSKYTQLDTFEENKNATIAHAKEFRRNRDNVVSAVVRSAGLVRVSLNADALKSGNTSVFDAFDNKIKEVLTIMGACQENARSIAGITGAAYPDFAPAKYKSSLEVVRVSVSNLKSKYDGALRDIADRDNTISGLKTTVADRDNTIVAKDKTLDNKELYIGQLKKMLDLGANMPEPWQAGSLASRKAMRGKVIEVNNKFGFCVIDLGRNTRVKQPIGNRVNEVDPQIEKDMVFRIARNADSANVEFIRRAKITNVLDDCSIIEAIDGDKEVKTGDVVYLVTDAAPASAQAAN